MFLIDRQKKKTDKLIDITEKWIKARQITERNLDKLTS